MDLNRLEHILDRAASKRITVIGDLMLDEFVWGKVGRISPEAPVPVVEVIEESFYPGGAANVARNLREFVDQVATIGLLGKDRSGQQLKELLTRQEIDISNAVEDQSFRTILKTRIIARHQQVVRVDREQFTGPSAPQLQQVVAAVQKNISDIDAIIFEDYGKGFLSTKMVSQITENARSAGKIVAADPNPRHLVDWRGVTVVKPNRAEALSAAGWRSQACRRSASQEMGNKICSGHPWRTRDDALPAERSAALHSHEGTAGFRCLRRGRHCHCSFHPWTCLRSDSD